VKILDHFSDDCFVMHSAPGGRLLGDSCTQTQDTGGGVAKCLVNQGSKGNLKLSEQECGNWRTGMQYSLLIRDIENVTCAQAQSPCKFDVPSTLHDNSCGHHVISLKEKKITLIKCGPFKLSHHMLHVAASMVSMLLPPQKFVRSPCRFY
jgi:hypothetical protein